MLLGYRFSTGNSIVKTALKAMTSVVCVVYTLVTAHADGYLGRTRSARRDSASRKRERFREEREALQIHTVYGDRKMCVSHAMEDVNQENTIFQVRSFRSFENTCMQWCMLLSEKRYADLLVLTENPNQDLAFVYKFPLKCTLSSKSIGS